MTGFAPGSSGMGSDRSANCATTTANLFNLFLRLIHTRHSSRLTQHRNRNYSISLHQCNCLPHASVSNAASVNDPLPRYDAFFFYFLFHVQRQICLCDLPKSKSNHVSKKTFRYPFLTFHLNQLSSSSIWAISKITTTRPK